MSLVQKAWELVTPWKNYERNICAQLEVATGLQWKSQLVCFDAHDHDAELGFHVDFADVLNPEDLAKEICDKLNGITITNGERDRWVSPFRSDKTIFSYKITPTGLGKGDVLISIMEPDIAKIDTSKTVNFEQKSGTGYSIANPPLFMI